MSLKQKVELLHRSSTRMLEALELSRSKAWWIFMRREAWLHLKGSFKVIWLVLRGKE